LKANDCVSINTNNSLQNITLKTDIPRGHKVATKNIPRGTPVIKYGMPIGLANQDIQIGEHVHVHNISFSEFIPINDELTKPRSHALASLSPRSTTFSGYKRRNGTTGVRNYIVVMADVNCSATVAKEIALNFRNTLNRSDIDGVVPVTYSGGCAHSPNTYAHEIQARTLSGWLEHPNVVAALCIGLGCETMNWKRISAHLTESDALYLPIENFNITEVGGTKAAIQRGINWIRNCLEVLPKFERTMCPVSELRIGTNCGGSDAFSGMTANPALGLASDAIVNLGGTSVFAEIPECYGAETTYLFPRIKSQQHKEKLKNVLNFWNDYYSRHRVLADNNLAAGNISGGISTILEKSLGAIAKSGSSEISAVIDYGERIKESGLVLMNTPGYDPASVTGLVAGGCNMIAFTTGRGSTFGCSIAPTLKIATNSAIFEKMSDDMDINAGSILDGKALSDVGEEIYETLLKCASGQQTKSEANRIGWEEFVPWSVGETL
jgi:altronate hydrolase